MIYVYNCEPCETTVDIQKPLAEMDREEKCEKCSAVMKRQICASPLKFGPGFFNTGGYGGSHVTFKYKDGSKETVKYDPNKVKKGSDD